MASLLLITLRLWIELTEAVLFPSTVRISLSIAWMLPRGIPAAEAKLDSEGRWSGGRRWRGACLEQMRREAWVASMIIEGSRRTDDERFSKGTGGEHSLEWRRPEERERSSKNTASWAT